MTRIVIDPMPDGSVVLAYHDTGDPDTAPLFVSEFTREAWVRFAAAVVRSLLPDGVERIL